MDTNGAFPDRLPISLEMFEGPIDLLLHLVKSNQLPIEKVSLAQVASQYLECIEKMARIDFELAGEYLVVAATLISIKSAVLLREPGPEMHGLTEEGLNPHDELLRRLREAAVYYNAAGLLRGRPMLGLDVFQPFPSGETAVSDIVLKDHDPMLLGKALRKLLGRLGEEDRSLIISIDPGTIADRMISIIDRLGRNNSVLTFDELVLAEGEKDRVTGAVILSTFLALLELCKRQVISVKQDDSFEDIQITLINGVIQEEWKTQISV
jgi:segregation and condensation protein A